MRHRQVRELVHGHTAGKGSSWDSNAGLLAQEAALLGQNKAPGHRARSHSQEEGRGWEAHPLSTENVTKAQSRVIQGGKAC